MIRWLAVRTDRILWMGVLTALAMASPSPAAAGGTTPEERPPLAPDRPDFTENPLVQAYRSLQLESGFTYEKNPGGAKLFNGPEALLRWGAWRSTELRLGLPDYVRAWGRGARTSGFSDTYIGLKHQLVGEDKPLTLALMPGLNVPTGSGAFSTGAIDPEVQLIWGRTINDKTALSGLFAGFWTKNELDRDFSWRATISLGRSLGGPWGSFLEYAGDYTSGDDSHVIHHGVTYALNGDSQVDIHYGFGMSRAAPDFFIGAGYVVRWW